MSTLEEIIWKFVETITAPLFNTIEELQVINERLENDYKRIREQNARLVKQNKYLADELKMERSKRQ